MQSGSVVLTCAVVVCLASPALAEKPTPEELQKSCDGGDVMGCHSLGGMYWMGEGVPRDYNKAVELHQRACDGGSAESCMTLVRIFENTVGVTSQELEALHAKAATIYGKACDGGDAAGCQDLGAIYLDGHAEKDKATAKDKAREVLTKAATIYARACDGGDAAGCQALGAIYLDGRVGVEKDKATAKDKTREVLTKAATIYGKACDGGDMQACLRQGSIYEKGQADAGTPGLSLTPFVVMLGGPTRAWGSDRKAAARAAAHAIYQRACAAGELSGCDSLAALYVSRLDELRFVEHKDFWIGKERDIVWREAVAPYEKACDGGNADGCARLGDMLIDGWGGVKKDQAKAAELLQKACDGRHAEACWSLGRKYAEGRGVEKDKAQAKELYQKACDLGFLMFCGLEKSPEGRLRRRAD